MVYDVYTVENNESESVSTTISRQCVTGGLKIYFALQAEANKFDLSVKKPRSNCYTNVPAACEVAWNMVRAKISATRRNLHKIKKSLSMM